MHVCNEQLKLLAASVWHTNGTESCHPKAMGGGGECKTDWSCKRISYPEKSERSLTALKTVLLLYVFHPLFCNHCQTTSLAYSKWSSEVKMVYAMQTSIPDPKEEVNSVGLPTGKTFVHHWDWCKWWRARCGVVPDAGRLYSAPNCICKQELSVTTPSPN